MRKLPEKEEYPYMKIDDTLDVGKSPLKHTNKNAQNFHDKIMKNKKSFLEKYKK